MVKSMRLWKLITKEILKHLIVVDFFFLVRHSRSILKMAGMWYFTNSNTNFSAKYFKWMLRENNA